MLQLQNNTILRGGKKYFFVQTFLSQEKKFELFYKIRKKVKQNKIGQEIFNDFLQ